MFALPLLATVVLLGTLVVEAQICHSIAHRAWLSKQRQVQEFAAAMVAENCTEVQSVILDGDVYDLTPLSVIRGVSGNLAIMTKKLTHLYGLSGIRWIEGGLSVTGTSSLLDLDGLDGVEYIGRDNPRSGVALSIRSNIDLQSISVLKSVRFPLPGSLTVEENPMLTSLHGLEGITSVVQDYGGWCLTIMRNDALQSLDGLQGMRRLGSIDVHNYYGVAQSLSIVGNKVLRNISALSGVSGSLPGGIHIEGNPALESLQGLEGVKELAEIYIPVLGASLVLRDNGNLNSLAALSNLTWLGGGLIVETNSALQSMEGLGHVSRLGVMTYDSPSRKYRGHSLHVQGNLALQSLAPFHSLSHIPGDLTIDSNPALATLRGLDSVRSAHGLFLTKNTKLRSLSALGNIRGELGNSTVARRSLDDPPPFGKLVVEHNPSLLSLHGLDGIMGAETISIQNNARLRSIAALRNIRTPALNLFVFKNPAMESLQGLQGLESAGNVLVSVDDSPEMCFPSADKVGALASVANLQPVWNKSSCQRCSASCAGEASGCDYTTGSCRCPLGFVGPNCDIEAPRLRVKAGQFFRCHRSKEGIEMVDCSLLITLCQVSGAELDATRISALALFPACSAGNATSGTCSSKDVSDFEVAILGAAEVHALSSTCVSLAAEILVQAGQVFEPPKVATLYVGYHPVLIPDILLEGTVINPTASASPPVYPWCLTGGDCKPHAAEPIQVVIEGRERQCPAGMYAFTGSPDCLPCGDGAVSKYNSHRGLHETWDSVCTSCSRWSVPNRDLDGCERNWWLIGWVSASFACLAAGLSLLATHVDASCIAASSFDLRGRSILIQDVSTEREKIILTTCGRHHLHQCGGRSFPIMLKGTGHYLLESPSTPRLRATVVGADRLELLDGKGRTLTGQYDTSMGEASLPLLRALFHTGWPVPMLVLAPTLLLGGLPGLLAAGQLHGVGDVTSWLLLATLPISALLAWLTRRLRPPTLLQVRLGLYQAQLQKERPDSKSCDRGPGRAIRMGQLWDFWEFFSSTLRERNMYYVEPNMVKPLTASSRLSFAELVGPVEVEWFVSHFWGHAYSQTCLALQRHAQSAVRGTAQRWTDVAYWVCTFSINQYRIPEELAGSNWNASSFFLALRSDACRGTCMVVDAQALPLERSWCLFELLQTLRRGDSDPEFHGMLLCTSSGILNHGEASIEVSLNLGKRVSDLRLEDAKASSAEDKAMIDSLVVSEMGCFDRINAKLRSHIADALNRSKEAALKDFDTIEKSLAAGVGMEQQSGRTPTVLGRELRLAAEDAGTQEKRAGCKQARLVSEEFVDWHR